MVVISTESGMMMHRMVLDNGDFVLGFVERKEFLERSRQEGFEAYLKKCREQVDCFLVVASFAECRNICSHIRKLLEKSGQVNLDAADVSFVAGEGKICSVMEAVCKKEEKMEEALDSLLERMGVENSGKWESVLLSIIGDITFVEGTELAERLQEKLNPEAAVLFGLQEPIGAEVEEKRILLMAAGKELVE